MKFTKRLTEPEVGNKYYTHYSHGGICAAIVINGNNGDVLPNCVGYAAGRYLEATGAENVDWSVPVCNAENFIERAQQGGFEIGTEPKVGAIICWQKGATLQEWDGAGHVAFVEEIKPDGSIITSESGYGAARRFWTCQRTNANGAWGMGVGYRFRGFIYPKVDFEVEHPAPAPEQPKEQPVTEEYETYTVVHGDCLWAIAERFLGNGARYEEIKELNGMSDNYIYTGDVLKLPIKKSSNSNKKSNLEIAREVYNGDWGNGQERRDRLEAAGYNYSEVQSIVNELVYGLIK